MTNLEGGGERGCGLGVAGNDVIREEERGSVGVGVAVDIYRGDGGIDG